MSDIYDQATAREEQDRELAFCREDWEQRERMNKINGVRR